MKQQIIQQIELQKVIAIVRGVEPKKCLAVASALYKGGIRLIEITFDQKCPKRFQETAEAISAVAQAFKGQMLVGAGTVVSNELVDLAKNAGAQYILSPDTNLSVIGRTLELGLVSIPGALTPTEVMTAHNAGADFVKLFPTATLGIAYIKALTAPISHVKLLAVGGVNADNISDFLAAGLWGAGVGGNLVNKNWIELGEYDKITTTARQLVAAIKR